MISDGILNIYDVHTTTNAQKNLWQVHYATVQKILEEKYTMNVNPKSKLIK